LTQHCVNGSNPLEVFWNQYFQNKIIRFTKAASMEYYLIPKPHPLLELKPKRLKKRPLVTFIVGLHCHDGIVLCADSQEGDRITKRYVYKLAQCTMSVNFDPATLAPPEPHNEDWGYCLGGAGYSASVDKFRDTWAQILGPIKKFDNQQLETTAETILRDMRDAYPDAQFDIALALSGGAPYFMTRLYRSYEGISCLHSIDQGDFICLGMDTGLAQFLLNALFDSGMGVDEAVGLAVLVTSLMKEHTDGVGGPTTMFSYTKAENQWHGYNQENIQYWDSLFPAKEVYAVLAEYWKAKNPEYKDRFRVPLLRTHK
jgi:hypothetical protein